jgi:hypothetical protein
MDARFEGMDARFEAMDARFEGMDARFKSIDAQFDDVRSDIAKLDAKLDRRTKALADALAGSDHRQRNRLDDHEKRLTRLEKR